MKTNKSVLRALMMVTQIGISMITPIFVAAFIGYQIDRLFHTSAWFIVFLLLGILAAFRNVYILTRKFYAKDLEKEEAEQAYLSNMRAEYEQNVGKDTVHEKDK